MTLAGRHGSGVAKFYGALGRMTNRYTTNGQLKMSSKIIYMLHKVQMTVKNLSNVLADGKICLSTPFGAPTCPVPWEAAYPSLRHCRIGRIYTNIHEYSAAVYVDLN